MTFAIITLTITAFFMATLTITVLCVVDHNNIKVAVSYIMLSVPSKPLCPYVEYNYVIFLIVIMLSVIFLIVTMLSIIFMNVLSWLSS